MNTVHAKGNVLNKIGILLTWFGVILALSSLWLETARTRLAVSFSR